MFSLSVVLSSSFVRIGRFYCTIVSDLENFLQDENFRESFVNESRACGLLSIPRQESIVWFNLLRNVWMITITQVAYIMACAYS